MSGVCDPSPARTRQQAVLPERVQGPLEAQADDGDARIAEQHLQAPRQLLMQQMRCLVVRACRCWRGKRQLQFKMANVSGSLADDLMQVYEMCALYQPICKLQPPINNHQPSTNQQKTPKADEMESTEPERLRRCPRHENRGPGRGRTGRSAPSPGPTARWSRGRGDISTPCRTRAAST